MAYWECRTREKTTNRGIQEGKNELVQKHKEEFEVVRKIDKLRMTQDCGGEGGNNALKGLWRWGGRNNVLETKRKYPVI
jgi:hypothetical protein